MIFIQQMNDLREGLIPFKVDVFTTVGQFMAMLFSVTLSEDVFIPIREITSLWITNKDQWLKVIGKNEEDSEPIDWFLKILLPNVFHIK